jgi:hypothetical protein
VTTEEQQPSPAFEDDEVGRIVCGFLAQQSRTAADQSRPLCRGTHAKGICVGAIFEVPDLANAHGPALSRRLAQGLFGRPGRYPSVVRFANSDPTINSDWQRDVRGMSFSIDLPSGGTGSAEPARQHWSLQSAPTLPFNDLRAFAVFGKVLAARSEAVGVGRLSAEERLVYATTKAAVLRQQRQQRARPYQQLRYWSNVPFRHGSSEVIKYSVTPVSTNGARAMDVRNPQALRDEIVRHVTEDQVMSAFDFAVQFLDTERMRFRRRRRDARFWIENASVEWPEHDSPFHTIARLTLLRGAVLPDADCERRYIDVNACSLPEHAPVGSINRARHFAERASRRARGVE